MALKDEIKEQYIKSKEAYYNNVLIKGVIEALKTGARCGKRNVVVARNINYTDMKYVMSFLKNEGFSCINQKEVVSSVSINDLYFVGHSNVAEELYSVCVDLEG